MRSVEMTASTDSPTSDRKAANNAFDQPGGFFVVVLQQDYKFGLLRWSHFSKDRSAFLN
jgi:hypothetical protein